MRRMTLFFSKKAISISKRNKVKTPHTMVSFFCLNCHHSFATGNKHTSRKKVYEDKYFCNVVMPSEDTNLLKFNHYQKCHKPHLIIYADLKCLIDWWMQKLSWKFILNKSNRTYSSRFFNVYNIIILKHRK